MRDFDTRDIAYLACILIRGGIKLHPKIKAIVNLDPPENCKDIHRLLSMVQYCRDVWQHCRYILSTLTNSI